MLLKLFQTDAYRALIAEHLFNTLAYLLESGENFAIGAEVEHIEMDPPLPRSITKTFGETALFVMSGYTLESAYLDEGHFYFEAGFGSDNIGAHVTIPLLAIKQIFVEDYPIAINIVSPVPFQKSSTTTSEHSMDALLRNPENQRFIKKTKR